ncbi:MAG: hypothetical protein Kow009_00640 [Spirochaetales bacterium]
MEMRKTFQHLSSLFKGIFKGRHRFSPGTGVYGKYPPIVTHILSDAMLFNEIPHTGKPESGKSEFILRKLHEFGISEPYQDEMGNIAAIFPASQFTDRYILLYTNMGTKQYSPLESLVQLTETHAKGMGITDESLAVAALLNFAEQMQTTAYEYPQNVICLFTNLAEEAGEFRALEHFIKNFPGVISFALYISSIHQGNFDPQPLGHCRLSVRISTPEQDVLNRSDWSASSVTVLSHIAFQLGNIQWDRESKTTLNIARLDAGVGFGHYPNEGVLDLEMFSLDSSMLETMRNISTATIEKIAQEMGAKVGIRLLSLVPPGNPDLNSTLLHILKDVYHRLKIKECPLPVPTRTTFLHAFHIPAVTLGITRGKKSKQEEYVEIAPIEVGFNQIPLFLEMGIEAMSKEKG